MAQISITKPSNKMKDVWQDRVYDIINLILVVLVLLIVLYPLYLVLICSISDAGMVTRGEVVLFPKGITFSGYEAILKNSDIYRSYLNSIIYTFSGTVISLGVTMGAAFTLSRSFPGKKLFALIFSFTMFFSGGDIPSFLVMKDLHLYNTPWICILMGCVSVWNIMLARTYITSTIPEALYEAANLDGATQLQYFFRIVIPLSGTIIAVLSVYYGIAKWNDYWTGLIYIRDTHLLPLQTVLKRILATLETGKDMLEALGADPTADTAMLLQRAQVAKYCVIVVSTVPAIVLYLCMQKFFVKGVMIGSIKG